MPFIKGQSGNVTGRPKGSYNAPIRSKLERLLHKVYPVIESELKTTTPEKRLEIFTDLAGIIFPKNTNQQNVAQ